MLEKKNDFSKAEVGDSVWNSTRNKYTVITSKKLAGFETNNWQLFSYDGTNIYGAQVIFWEKPKIEFQPDPVRKVEKELVLYALVLENKGLPEGVEYRFSPAKYDEFCYLGGKKVLSKNNKIVIKYEVEE